MTPRGAATGQAAGAVALGGGIVLAMNAMNRVLEIDVANMQAFCEPGVVHAQLNAALAPHGLLFPPDPGSSRMATVGGMASTNAHGMRAVKYGPTSAWVLGLEVVLPDGQVIETGSVGSRAKQSSAGLELTKLIVGAEGTLGVVTRLRLKLMAIPPARAIVLGLFDALEQAGQAVQAVFGAGVSPSAIEILDERCIQAINLYRPAMDLPRVEALILFEVDGNPPGVRWDAERICEVIGPFAQRTEWSDEPGRINALWEARSVVGAAVGTLRPGLEPGLLRRGHLRARRQDPRDAARDPGHQRPPPHPDRHVRPHRRRRPASWPPDRWSRSRRDPARAARGRRHPSAGAAHGRHDHRASTASARRGRPTWPRNTARRSR